MECSISITYAFLFCKGGGAYGIRLALEEKRIRFKERRRFI